MKIIKESDFTSDIAKSIRIRSEWYVVDKEATELIGVIKEDTKKHAITSLKEMLKGYELCGNWGDFVNEFAAKLEEKL